MQKSLQQDTTPEYLKAVELKNFIVAQLEESKANEISVIEIGKKSSIADFMVICSGTSSRHVKSIANFLSKQLKDNHKTLLSTEGEDTAEWILLDAGDVVVHIMQLKTRDYYQLEKLWE